MMMMNNLNPQQQDEGDLVDEQQDEERVRVVMNGNNGMEDIRYSPARSRKLSYRQTSFLAAAALLFYAFRTRQQYSLAMVYLSSSKWAYVVFGNALIAGLITIFDTLCTLFLNGLRLNEAEGLQDFFRWNVTETCLALTGSLQCSPGCHCF